MLFSRVFGAATLLASTFFLLAPRGLGQEIQWDRFRTTTVCGDLVQPMELAVAPDGGIFLIELAGVVKRVDPATSEVRVVGQLEVTTAQENGLIGLALDPHFADNGWIYLQYSPPEFPGQQISRFRYHDGQLDLASEKQILRFEEQRRECCHHAGSLEFGPDGLLYIGTGDNTNPFNDSQGYAPLDERADRGPWDAQRTAGNTKSYNGKVLRIRPEPDGSYSIPEGNLFPPDGSIGHPEIYVMGCRNPWRINVDPRTGILYWGDVGPDAGQAGPRGPRGYDEINQARVAGNFGWPYFIGDNQAYAMVDFASGEIGDPQDPQQPINESVNNTGSRRLPPAQPAMVYYPGGGSEKFPAVGTGGRTACAGPVYYEETFRDSETRFPADFDQALFAYDWSRNGFWTLHLDEDSNLQRLSRFLPEQTFVRPVDMAFSPQGSLYVIEYGTTWGVNPDTRLVHIDYVRGNRAPVAVAQAESTVGREPLTVRLSGSESFDRDGDALDFQWWVTRVVGEQPQRRQIAAGKEAEVTFAEAGVFTVNLEVRDPTGALGSTSLPVVVGNARPEVTFLRPQDGDFFDPGQPVRFRLCVRDREDGTSDFEEAEEGPLPFIESRAPSRLQVRAFPANDAADLANEPAGLALIRKSDCFNCHAPQRRLVGPGFVEIATKYRDQPHQLEQSVKRVLKGSTGVWGKVGMLPHLQHSPGEVRQMVEYVYSVTADSSNPTSHGFNNEIELPEDASAVRLEATYTDLGRGDIPKLTGVAGVRLRSREVEAEAADAFAGTQVLGSGNAAGQKFMGAIEHDGFLRFDDLSFSQFDQVVVRVASAGAGGRIELRRDAADGPLLGEATVEVNGDWEAFYEKPISVRPPTSEETPRGTLFVVFQNPQRRSGLMNLDSLRFIRKP